MTTALNDVLTAAREVRAAVTRKPEDFLDMQGFLWDARGECAVERLIRILDEMERA